MSIWENDNYVPDTKDKRIEELHAKVAKLSEALKPFANFAEYLSDACPDNIALGIYADGGMQFGPGGVSVADLRLANKTLKGG
jgi:hypothetical protein